MLTLLAGMAMCLLPHEAKTIEKVDVIEFNHFYDDKGDKIFVQAILYDWNRTDSRYDIRAWRLVKEGMPALTPQRGQWRLDWVDGQIWRRVSAPQLRESHTQYDVELIERETLPQHLRRELSTPQKPGRK